MRKQIIEQIAGGAVVFTLSIQLAHAGDIKIDTASAKLTSGRIASGTICGKRENCNLTTLSIKDADGNTQSLQLDGGTVVAGTVTNNPIIKNNGLKDYKKIESGTVSGATLEAISLDDVSLKEVEINDAKLITTTVSSDGKITTSIADPIKIDKSMSATLEHASIRSANITDGEVQIGKSAISTKLPNQISTEAANISYVGDYFHFLVEAPGFTPMNGGDATTVPANSCFRVDVDSPGSTKVNGKFVSLNSEAPSANLLKHAILNKCAGLEEVKPSQPPSNKYPPTDKEYTVDKAVFDNYSRERYGWTYGVLAAPFKYYPGQSQFSSSISIDAYLGYRIHDRQGSSTVLAFAAGPAFATVKTANGNSNINGASIAVALLSEIKRSFNVGVILGCDFFSKADGYALSGRPYLGINFGIKAD